MVGAVSRPYQHTSELIRTFTLPLLAIGALSCAASDSSSENPGAPEAPSPVEPTATAPLPPIALQDAAYPAVFGVAALRQLTAREYQAAVTALLQGPPPELSLAADVQLNGLTSVGHLKTAVSGIAAQRFESAAFEVAQRYLASINTCNPDSPDCFSQFVRSTGRELWRRPLTDAEVARYVAVAERASKTLADPMQGFEFALAGLLQSPYFLYRVEVGEPDAVLLGRRRLSDHELAARLSFFLTASPPDAELSASADSGTVHKQLGAHAERLLRTVAARDAAGSFLSEYMQLGPLRTTEKSAALFPSYDASLRAAMYQQTVQTLTELAFVEGLDFRQLFTTRRTFLNSQLAALYGVDSGAAAGAEALSPFEFAPNTPRVGLLSHASFLALNAHASSTSPTRRGKFVRQVLLCQAVAPPPPGLVSELTTVDAATKTSRERLRQHADNPACRDCHLQMDPIGLGFENFDAIGAFRKTHNAAPIDPSGTLDGTAFDNAPQLSELIALHPALTRCLVRTVFHQASGTLATPAEEPVLDLLNQRFAEHGYRLPELLRESASHPAFGFVREASPTAVGTPGEAP